MIEVGELSAKHFFTFHSFINPKINCTEGWKDLKSHMGLECFKKLKENIAQMAQI